MSTNTLGTILIVEDDSELRFILAVHLRAAGFAVIEAGNGAEAIACAEQGGLDVIIMDVGLPVLDGLTATRRLKHNPKTAGIPVIMLTARTATNDVVKGLEAGAQEYLLKPFEVAEVLARVRTVFKLASAHRALDKLNTQLEAEVDAKTRRLQVLYEYMRDLNHASDREAILDLVMRCVGQATCAGRISLFLLNEVAKLLCCERALGMDPRQVPPMHVDEAPAITGRVLRLGSILTAPLMESGHEENGSGTNGKAAMQRVYTRDSFVSTPSITTSLQTRDGIIGVLKVSDKTDKSPFCTEEIECVRTIADAAAIALDNVTRRVRLQHSVKVLLATVGRLAEYRDEETTLHLERVSRYARVLAMEMQRAGAYAPLITDDFVQSLVQAAPLHDIGKVGISDDILTKPGKLTDEEFQIMKSHTDIGRRVLSEALDPAYPVPLLQMCIEIAWCHHERFDGKGYPRRLKGETIPLSARIISVVDAYDAITSRRRYKAAKSHAHATDIITAESGKHFDPAIVESFLKCADKFDEVRRRYEETDAAEAPAAAS